MCYLEADFQGGKKLRESNPWKSKIFLLEGGQEPSKTLPRLFIQQENNFLKSACR